MSTPLNTFADLAHWLLLGAVNACDISDLNADLVAPLVEDAPGILDKAVSVMESGDLPGAVVHLSAAIERAAVPVEAPTTGRRRLERFQFATEQRDSLRRTAQITRVLVLDAIKAWEVSV